MKKENIDCTEQERPRTMSDICFADSTTNEDESPVVNPVAEDVPSSKNNVDEEPPGFLSRLEALEKKMDTFLSCQNNTEALEKKVDMLFTGQSNTKTLEGKVDTLLSCQHHTQALDKKVDTLLSCQNQCQTLEAKVDTLLSFQNDTKALEGKVDALLSCQHQSQTLEAKVDTLLSCQNHTKDLEKKVDTLLSCHNLDQDPETKVDTLQCYQSKTQDLENNVSNKIQAKELEMKVDALATGQDQLLKMLESLAASNKKDQKPNSAKKKPRTSPLKPNGRPPSVQDMSSLLHLPAALQENISVFTRDLTFSDATGLPDLLQEKGCLTSDDYERICAKSNPVDQVRMLIRKIRDRGPQIIQTFLDILNTMGAFAHLAENVRESLKRIVELNSNGPVCVICVVKQTVDIKDIVDDLWREHVITDDMHGTIVEAESIYPHRACFWNEVISYMNEMDDTNKALLILKQALDVKYKYINEYLADISKETKIGCICCRRRTLRRRPSDWVSESESEYSATSTTLKSNIPSKDLINSRNVSEADSEPESESQYSSFDKSNQASHPMFKPAYFFDLLDRFDSIGSLGSSCPQLPVSEETSGKHRHRSGHFVPQALVLSESEERNASLGYINEQTQTGEDGEKEKKPSAYDNEVLYNPPDYNRSVSKMSNVTITGNVGSSSGDNHSAYDTERKVSSLSDDNHGQTNTSTPSPSVHNGTPAFGGKSAFGNNAVDGYKSTKESSVGNGNAMPNDSVFSEPSVDGVLADIDDDEYAYIGRHERNKRRNLTKRRLKLFMRTDSTVPTATMCVTSPRKVGVNASAKVANSNNQKVSRHNKQSMRRELRRQKSARENDGFTTDNLNFQGHHGHGHGQETDDPGLKMPYSPMRGKVPYNQARRHWMMSQYMASPPDDGVLGNSISDTEFKTEDSDAMVHSDIH